MADQKITELPIKGTSAINLADYLLGIDSADGYQMLISDLAKKIIEAYNGSSLGGSARTLKSALDTIATNSGSNLATIETSTTASKAYAVGDYLVMNGILYKVTAAIASGGTITVDTNVTVAAAGDDIAAIAAKIGNTTMGTTATTITGAIAEHEADISGLNSNVTGYGSNTNGEYWKFLDGTLICAKRITASMNFTTAFGSWYETPSAIQFGDWPIPFISIPVAQVTVLSRMAIAESLQYLSPTSAGSSYFARPNSVQTQDTTVHIIGIGRWK